MLRNYELERMYSPEQQQIKTEPRDRTPPHHNISSPPQHGFPPQYDQNWQHGLESLQAGLAVGGPSHVQHVNPFAQDMWASQPYQPLSPNHLQPMAQTLQVLQPNMQAMSPNMQPVSPNMQPMSPNMQHTYGPDRMSPNMSVMSPHAQTMSPNMQVMSPMGRVSPNMQQNMGHISPNLGQQQPTYGQQPQQQLMETEQHSASLSNLLLDRADGSLLLNSGDLSGLSALLGERPEPQALDY